VAGLDPAKQSPAQCRIGRAARLIGCIDDGDCVLAALRLFRHSRASGNPASRGSTGVLDSRLRGNDGPTRLQALKRHAQRIVPVNPIVGRPRRGRELAVHKCLRLIWISKLTADPYNTLVRAIHDP